LVSQFLVDILPLGSESVDLHISTDPDSEYFADPTYLYLSRYPSEALEHLDHLDLQLNLGSNIFILSSTPPLPHKKKYIFYSEVLINCLYGRSFLLFLILVYFLLIL